MTIATANRKTQLKDVVESYFQALRDKDFSAIPFSGDIVFRAPIAPGDSHYPIKGKQAVFEQWWKPLEPALDGATIDIVDHYYNESLNGVITKADITIPLLGSTLRAADRFIIDDEGKIIEQENHFDASPMKSYIHHIGLRSMDFNVTKNFYGNTLGWKLVIDKPELIIFLAGGVGIAFKKAGPRDKQYSSFSPFEVGLDHIAITCEREEELHQFAKKLAYAGRKYRCKTGPCVEQTLYRVQRPRWDQVGILHEVGWHKLNCSRQPLIIKNCRRHRSCCSRITQISTDMPTKNPCLSANSVRE